MHPHPHPQFECGLQYYRPNYLRGNSFLDSLVQFSEGRCKRASLGIPPMSISRSLPPLFHYISSNIWFRGPQPQALSCCLHHVGKILEEPRPGLKQPCGLTCMFSVCCYAEQQEYFNTRHFYHGNHKRRQSTFKLYWIPPKRLFCGVKDNRWLSAHL